MDFWARLLQGDAFWQLGHILKQDVFSYTPTHIWIDHEWGSSVIFSYVQNTFGFKGILFLKNILIFLIFFFMYKTVQAKRNLFSDLFFFVIAAVSMPSLMQSGLRCHFFTFLFFTVFIYILELVRKEGKDKLLVLLPIIMLFWVNMHGGCVAGLGLIGIYAVGEFLNKKTFKKYIYTLLACFAMLFINPYGIEYIKFIFSASLMKRPFVTEWTSPFAHNAVFFMWEFKLFFIACITLVLLSIKKIKNDYTKYILFFVCAFLACMYIKNIPFFIITATIFFYYQFKVKKIYSVLAMALVFIVCLAMAVKNHSPNYLSQLPVKETEFLKINDLKGKILAPFHMGSYMIYKLYPNNLLYMDGRYEEVYYPETKELLDDFYNVQNEGYKILDGDTKPDYIVVPKDALLNDYLIHRNDYTIVYESGSNFVYSHDSLLKRVYALPSQDYAYYINNAFKSSFKYK